MYNDSTIYTKNNMKGLVACPLLVGGLGPGPPGPPLNPALQLLIAKFGEDIVDHRSSCY